MRCVRQTLCVLCLLAMPAAAGAQSAIETPIPARRVPMVGASSVAESPLLNLYDTSDALPDFPAPGVTIGPGIPGQGYYPIRGRSWVQLDYLLWWVQGQNIPPLAVDPAGGVVAGATRIDDEAQSGLRLGGGYFFDCDGLCGLMVDFFALDGGGERIDVVGGQPGAYGLPYTDMDLTLPSNQGPDGCVCPDGSGGTPTTVPIDSISARSESQIWSGGAYYRGRIGSAFNCCASSCGDCASLCRYGYRLDGIAGYRYFGFDESLGISGVLAPETGAIVARDRFATDNDFHGVDLGLIYEVDHGRWSLQTVGRMGLGVNFQELTIAGSGNQQGGIFAQPTNIGRYEHDAFTVIPECDLILAYAVTPCLRARVGYSALLLSNVIRPATQIDTRVDGRYFDATAARPLTNPLPLFPQPRYETESVWMHGLTFGFDYSF